MGLSALLVDRSFHRGRGAGAPAELADEPAAEADGDRVGARARLELGQEVADVRLDRLLRQEEPLADLPVHEPVRDELEDLDLAHRRLLFERLPGRLERNHRRRRALGAPPGGHRLEAAGVVEIAIENLLAFCSVHVPSIGLGGDPL